MTNPGTPYEGSCDSCGRTIRAVLFFDWLAVKAPASLTAECGCQPFGHRVELELVAGLVSTAAMRAGL